MISASQPKGKMSSTVASEISGKTTIGCNVRWLVFISGLHQKGMKQNVGPVSVNRIFATHQVKTKITFLTFAKLKPSNYCLSFSLDGHCWHWLQLTFFRILFLLLINLLFVSVTTTNVYLFFLYLFFSLNLLWSVL